MDIFFSLLTLAGLGYGLYRLGKWMVRAGRSVPSRELPLSPNDLKVLEESAARLMADLRAVSEECAARVEAACDRAERVLRPTSDSAPRELASISEEPERAQMLLGEMELVKGLQQISRS